MMCVIVDGEKKGPKTAYKMGGSINKNVIAKLK